MACWAGCYSKVFSSVKADSVIPAICKTESAVFSSQVEAPRGAALLSAAKETIPSTDGLSLGSPVIIVARTRRMAAGLIANLRVLIPSVGVLTFSAGTGLALTDSARSTYKFTIDI
jgi:hypothetical protein